MCYVVLAYGQTGSGKTYTMGTAGRVSNQADIGIVPRFIEDLYVRKAQIEQEHPGSTILITVNYLEVYGDDINDLLEMDESKKSIVNVITDPKGGCKVINQRSEQASSAEELQTLLERGSLYRITGETSMNQNSSRSHAIFTVLIDQEIRTVSTEGGEGGEELVHNEIKQSKFHFVDLAGSEKVYRTQSTGLRLKEGININLGLLTLGKVIRALGDERNKGRSACDRAMRCSVPPYRDSKLTRLLMDSLGGNAKTLMIACVSPASDSIAESEGTLRYAASAKNIENKPIVNRDENDSLIVAVLVCHAFHL